MAKKRMFNLTVIDSDQFLEMPLSTQALYFHLNMRADDDGFVGNPRRIMGYIGASSDDYKLLIAKSFLIVFETGVIVIKHWRMHNTLQADRYTQTNYTDEKSVLYIKKNKSYTLDKSKGKPLVSATKTVLEEKCKQNVSTDIDIDIDIDKGLDIDKDKELDKDKNNSKKTTVYFAFDEKLNETFMEYLEMRKRIKKPATDYAIKLAISRLKKLATIPFSDTMDNDLAIQILEQSILSSWQGLFELKNQQKGNSQSINWDNV